MSNHACNYWFFFHFLFFHFIWYSLAFWPTLQMIFDFVRHSISGVRHSIQMQIEWFFSSFLLFLTLIARSQELALFVVDRWHKGCDYKQLNEIKNVSLPSRFSLFCTSHLIDQAASWRLMNHFAWLLHCISHGTVSFIAISKFCIAMTMIEPAIIQNVLWTDLWTNAAEATSQHSCISLLSERTVDR